jgi:hypothetical membrane protein
MSKPRKNVYQQIGAWAGIAAPLLSFTCILSAIAYYPQFNWANNALSDLGIVSGITGPLFNFGLIAGGLLTFTFAALGLFIYFGKSWVGKIGSAVFAAASVALIAIGVFNESFSGTHYIVSVLFFVLAPIALFILTCAFWLAHRRGLAVFSVAVGVAAAVPWILELTIYYVPNVAIPETVSGLAVSVWAIVLAKKMLTQ